MSPARFSVRQIVLMNLAFLVVMLAGLIVSQRLPVDLYPDISFNRTIILTIWPGASPDEVERLVTSKIEEEILDVSGIKEWSSYSSAGKSEIDVSWEETLSETDYQGAIANLRAAVDRVQDLPDDAEESIIRELSVSEVFEICFIAISDAGGVGEYTLREVARRMERLAERVPGVRKGRLMGTRDRELRVYVDQDRALQFDLTLPEISHVIAANNVNMPGGTFTGESDREVSVRGLGSYRSPEALAATIIKKSPSGVHVALGDVARIEDGFGRRTFYGYVNGRTSINIGISKEPDADVGRVIADLRALVAREAANLPDGIEASVIWDSSVLVDNRIEILESNLVLGVVFVVFLLWLTVGFRNALLAIIGVPFSFLTALLLFPVLDITINLISLVGFVMVSGMLVDDAIIVLENVYRHLEEGKDLERAVIEGTEEVMWPVISAVATTIAAFVPMLLVTGTSGEFMSILPKAVIACMLGSLIECLFVLPAHYVDWGSRTTGEEAARKGAASGLSALSHRARSGVDGILKAARDGYLRLLEGTLAHRHAFLALCCAVLFMSFGLGRHVAVDLFPSDFNQIFITVKAPSDYSIEQTNRVVLDVQEALAPVAHEFDESFVQVGMGLDADESPTFLPNYGLIYLSFPNTRENAGNPGRLLRLLNGTMADYLATSPPGLDSVLVAPPRNGPPIGKPVAVRIVTDDYDLAKRLAGEIKRELAGMAGVYNITDNTPLGTRELRIGLDETRASLHGLTFDDIALSMRAANDGLVPSTFKDPLSDEDIDIRVLPEEDQRSSSRDILDVDVRTQAGYKVKLADVATVAMQRSYQQLYHFDAQRTVVVYADVDTDQTSSTAVNEALAARFADTERRYDDVQLIFGGEFEKTNLAFEDMGRAFLVALLAIYAILAAQFRSYLQPLVVMTVIAFAYIGVSIGLFVFGYKLSMYVLYAIIGLAGIVVNDSLVLIDFVNKERALGTDPHRSVILAGSRRFRAIVLTTLTTIVGLLPMALGVSGKSLVFGPFAASIVAGLAVSSALTLFMVPCLYLTLEDARGLRGRLRPRLRPRDPAREIRPAGGLPRPTADARRPGS